MLQAKLIAACMVLTLLGGAVVPFALESPLPAREEESTARQEQAPAKASSKSALPQRDANQLLEHLLQVPEVGWSKLDAKAYAELREQVQKEHKNLLGAAEVKDSQRLAQPLDTQRHQWQTHSLTALGDPDCQLTEERAKILRDNAAQVRSHGFVSMPDRKGNVLPPRRVSLGSTYSEKGFPFNSSNQVPRDMLPAFVQMLEPEMPGSRAVLVELLSHCDDAAATVALARRAVFDIDPEVRHFATNALKLRKPTECRQTLLDAFRHPWSPAADHAAEALITLEDTAAVPALKKLIDAPSPPSPQPRSPKDTTPVVREMVRVNHLTNCVLCHAMAVRGSDPLAAQAPVPGSALPSGYDLLRGGTDAILVRADVTYLRQDFSVTLPVSNAKPWPDGQRFDFLVRTREATKEEIEAAKSPPATYPQREAVLSAIRSLERLKNADKP